MKHESQLMNQQLKILTLLIISLLSSLLLQASSTIEITEINGDKLGLDVAITDTSKLDSFEIQESSDLNSWSTIKTETDLSKNATSHELELSSEAQYLRLKLNESTSSNIPVDYEKPQLSSITGNSFNMGRTNGDMLLNTPISEPEHPVNLSNYQLGIYEISNKQAVSVFNWAIAKGTLSIDDSLSFWVTLKETNELGRVLLEIGFNNNSTHRIYNDNKTLNNADKYDTDPCVKVTWIGAIYFCNLASQIDGYTPCYDLETLECDFSANGYRLPTEAEWEYAAESGLEDTLFPFGDEITHNDANYVSEIRDFDISSTRGNHPDYMSDGEPYLAPVNAFSPNSYGIYNLAGNVAEWCFDTEYEYPDNTVTETDPKHTEGDLNYRIVRGGSWSQTSPYAIVTQRESAKIDNTNLSIGFRVCRKAE